VDYAAAYGELHRTHPKWFQGLSSLEYEAPLRELVAATRPKPKRVLDYGSGKGHQYLVSRLHERAGFPLPHCYDPGVRGLHTPPEGHYDLVICIDVLEHLDPADVPATLAALFGLAAPGGALFLAIGTTPASARKQLPDGRNMHLCVQPPAWWHERLAEAAVPDVPLWVEFDERVRA